ncbi:Methyltransferase domain-containing protein [Fodinibius salinus]|uniref:Methyltransferase domain-containing protein n=1 Tax=Fodinibius salinus TaxID=860790 RepID=A0A5D3YQA5_9BACT|nr:class I SAM-dependent methyltransferase [Fodinibius salinus]TYP95153.1 Methyltransferase domain-containing protein [Fodinibius salinus]
MTNTQGSEYTKLADVYDTLMEDVDYGLWADFIDVLMLQHHPDPQTVLELACGTGSLSYALRQIDDYRILATDKSHEMIAKARKKKDKSNNAIQFQVMDFLDININRTFDVVVSIFDSINYLQSADEVQQFLSQTQKVLAPNSLLIFDFTTPKNSVKSIDYLDDEEGYTDDGYRFIRESSYNPDKQIHTNSFKIEELADDQETVIQQYRETHQQRAYTLQQMLDIINESTYNIRAKYDGFDFEEADEQSLRITMVLQCPNTQ